MTTGEPVTPETRFGLASPSKSLTAVATLKLVEQGKLGLDDGVFVILNDISSTVAVTLVDLSSAEATGCTLSSGRSVPPQSGVSAGSRCD